MTPEERFEQTVLFEVVETSLPLWEVASEAAVLGSDLDSTSRIAKARELVRRLLKRRWVELLETEYLGDETPAPPERLVAPTRVEAVLEDPDVWDYERVGDARTRYLLYRTELGAREFKQQLMREESERGSTE